MRVCGLYQQPIGKLCNLSLSAPFGCGLDTRGDYSFMTEWMTKNRRHISNRGSARSSRCGGVQDATLVPLYPKHFYGSMSSVLLQNTDFLAEGMPVFGSMDTSTRIKFLSREQVPAAYGGLDCIRSLFCTQITTQGGTCVHCTALSKYKNLVRDATRAFERSEALCIDIAKNDGGATWEYFANLQNESLSTPLLICKANTFAALNRTYRDGVRGVKARQDALNGNMVMMNSRIQTADEKGDLAGILFHLQQMDADRTLRNPKLAKEVIQSIVTRCTDYTNKRRPVSSTMKLFFSRLLLHGGPHIHDIVSNTMYGPSLATTRSFLRGFRTYQFYNWSVDRFMTAAHVLECLDLKDAPCILAEDGTALERHFDVITLKNSVVLLGAARCAMYSFLTMEDLASFANVNAQDAPLPASELYVYMLVPLVRGAPAIPVVAKLHDKTNSTMNADIVSSAWKDAWRFLTSHGVHMVGHSGDGASPFRKATLHHQLRAIPDNAESYIRIPHFLIQIVLPCFDNKFPMVVVSDFIHIVFRLRRIFLAPNKVLVMFRLVCSPAKLQTYESRRGNKPSTGLRPRDLDSSDKQNWSACMRLFDIHYDDKKGTYHEKRTVRDFLKDTAEYAGSWLYVEMSHAYASIFLLVDMSLKEMLVRAAFVLTILGYWDMSISHDPQHTVKENFLTKETKDDIILSLNNIILAVKFFSQRYPHVQFTPNKWSSKECEYAFQHLRLDGNSNDNKITALSAMNRLEVTQGLLVPEQDAAHFKGMKSKRGVPRATERVSSDWNRMPAGYYPTLQEQLRALDEGVDRAMTILRRRWTSPGSGGETFQMWSAIQLPKPLKQSTPLRNIHEYMVQKHLLTQRPHGAKDWDEIFSLGGFDGSVPINVTDDEDGKYAHDEPDDDVQNSHPRDTLRDNPQPPSHDPLPSSSRHGGEKERSIPIPPTHSRKQKGKNSVSVQEQDEGRTDDLGSDLIAKQIVRILEKNARKANVESASSNTLELKMVEKVTRRIANGLNDMYDKMPSVRQMTRFVQDSVALGVKQLADPNAIEDEDYVAFWEPVVLNSKGPSEELSHYISLGMVERCLTLTQRGRNPKLKDTPAVGLDDKDGRVVVRFFEPIRSRVPHAATYETELSCPQRRVPNSHREHKNCLLFKLPINSRWGYRDKQECASILMTLKMYLCTELDAWVLPKEDEDVLWALVRRELVTQRGNKK
jgi:hypothetical protein